MVEPSLTLPAPSGQPFASSDQMRRSPVFTPTVPQLASPALDWSHALPCAAMGGFLALFLSFIPFFFFGPASLAAGAFAVFLYRRRTLTQLSRRAGARLGAASGGFAFLFLSIVIVATVFYAPDKIREAMANQLKAGHYDPEAVRNLTSFVSTNVGLAACVIFTLLILLLICVVGASIGGAWYSAWLQKRDRG